MIVVQQGKDFKARVAYAPTGLAGTMGISILDPDDRSVIVARSTAGIAEWPAGSGFYEVDFPAAPSVPAGGTFVEYQVAWDKGLDGSGNPICMAFEDLQIWVSNPPVWVVSGAVPTEDEIRDESDVPFAELGYGSPLSGQTDRLTRQIQEAVVQFQGILAIDPLTVQWNPAALGYEQRTPLIRKAIRQLVEYNVGSKQPEVMESVFDYDILESMNVTGYSESRRNNMRTGLSIRNVLHPWPDLNMTLMVIKNFAEREAKEFPSVTTRALSPPPGEDYMGTIPGQEWLTGDGLYRLRVMGSGAGPPLVGW